MNHTLMHWISKLIPPLTPTQAFSKAARLGRWPHMIALLKQHSELAFTWRGYDPYEQESFSAMALASRVGMPTLVRVLLQAGASADDVDERGDSPLHQISLRAHRFSEMTDYQLGPHSLCALVLIQHGASINRPNVLGFTPLALCAMERQRWLLLKDHSKTRSLERLMLILAEHGANPRFGQDGRKASEFIDADFLDRLICLREKRIHLSAFAKQKSQEARS